MVRRFVALLISTLLAIPALPQDANFSTTVKLVVVDCIVTDKNGRPIETLTQDDFQIFEDGKPQQIRTAELQRLNTKPLPPTSFAARNAPLPPRPKSQPVDTAAALTKYQDRRLIVIFLDFSSMDTPEQIRATQAAEKFISTQLTASDMVSIMMYSSSLQTLVDFTDDRDLLLATLHKVHIGEGAELVGQADEGADSQDQSGQFVADETEFNIFNTDLKLMALEDAARKLAPYPERKALVYFSSGVQKTGVDNQSQLRATVNTAVQSNVAFYPVDARGLTASAPGGDATQAAAVGSNLYSGAGQQTLRENFYNQQETLDTLAADTGGKALLDSNDLTLGLRQVQQDVNSYYVLAYYSTNTAEDGRYRRIQVKLAPRAAVLKAKLSYREGYYASTTFAKMREADKEAQLARALASDNPVTDLPLAVEVDYFRVAKGKYFVPLSVKIPGSALAFKNKGSKAATELDFIGQVEDAKNKAVAAVRDTIPIKIDQTVASEVTRKQIQYDTGFTLAPGKYKLRFVARENGEGKTGTFETGFTVPDLGSGAALRMSSVILSNQREPVKRQIAGANIKKKLLDQNPLIDPATGQKTVPNVTRVFRPGQNLSVYFEVYDPASPAGAANDNSSANPANRFASIAATVGLYQGSKKVFESRPVRVYRLSARGDGVLPVRIETPLTGIAPGQYTCQVNVIDEFGKKFAFPRTSLAVLAQAPAPAPGSAVPGSTPPGS
ncbi:VWA domain-containing protein [Nevskia soli]|uniref:VWA domain-containing protein n=1 Tax=Nevskia soli TaxID=418856 RepID=UPI0015D79277|nr:VWA domain-containing protein [Nevskia soli]